MKKEIKVTINGKKITALSGQTILEITQGNGIEIPTLCYHPDLEAKATCRVCVVEIKNRKGLHTACSTKAEEGMVIFTESQNILRARKINLELLIGQHCENCNNCRYLLNCKLRDLAKKYKVVFSKFKDRKINYPVYKFGPSVVFDSTKCINCRNCVEACQRQSVNFLELKEANDFFEVLPSNNTNRDCIYCGQCIVHCPVGAFEVSSDIKKVEKALANKNKRVVFQFAPSIRTSIGEEFSMPYGSVVTDKLVAGMKKLGAYKVFDTSVGADFTTVEEAKELIHKIKTGAGVCLSSCCPAWVKFVEFNYPEFIKNIATTRSPQMILGGIIKNYWAKLENTNKFISASAKIKPENIVVVSIMPCVAKKYESQRKELEINGLKPVDYALSTRELADLFKENKINLNKIAPQKADDPMGFPSGAGVIYGASGGVAESALRTAYFELTKKDLTKLELKQVRGIEGMKKAKIRVGGKTIKIAVVNGIGNAKKIIEELKKNPKAYDAVEVMACFGGCIGGGGQPLPVDDKIRKQRMQALYNIDNKDKIRLAHKNPIVKKVYEEFLNKPSIIHKICHTKYFKKKKENYAD